MDNTLKIITGVLITVLLVCLIFLGAFPHLSEGTIHAGPDLSGNRNVTVYFFYGDECPHCHTVLPFIRNLSLKYPEVDFLTLEIWHNKTNKALYESVHHQIGKPSTGVPEVIVIGNTSPLVGDRNIPLYLEDVILEQLKKSNNT